MLGEGRQKKAARELLPTPVLSSGCKPLETRPIWQDCRFGSTADFPHVMRRPLLTNPTAQGLEVLIGERYGRTYFCNNEPPTNSRLHARQMEQARRSNR